MSLPMQADARRATLQEFQQQLTQRLRSAQQARQDTRAYLACTTSTRRWLFELAHTDQILADETPTPVPFTRSWFLGLVNYRGQLISVIDLDRFAGAETPPWQRTDRLLVLSADLPLRCALRVAPTTRVIDRTHLRSANVAANTLEAIPAWVADRWVATDRQDYFSVDLFALMASPAFLDITQPDFR